MTIALLREGLSSHAIEHVSELPRWAMPESPEGYWHIPRSAERHVADFGYVRFWCGVSRPMSFAKMTNKTPPAMRCGTCEGRANGYEQRDGAIFRPRSPFDLPKLCPGSMGDDHSDRLCSYCGGKRTGHYDGGGWREGWHRTAEGLSRYTPCPRHGWRFTRVVDGKLTCCEWGYGQKCGHVLVSGAPEQRETQP